jgi:hypothetical protein
MLKSHVSFSSKELGPNKDYSVLLSKAPNALLDLSKIMHMLQQQYDCDAGLYGSKYPVRIYMPEYEVYYRDNCSGYTADGLEAGIYELDAAVGICNSRTSTHMRIRLPSQFEVAHLIYTCKE